MEAIDLQQLGEGYRGKPLRELIEYHMRRMGQKQRINAVLGTVELLPSAARPLVEEFIDRWNARAYDQEFWGTDTAIVLDEITEDARELLSQIAAPTDDDTLFNMFNIVVMNFAYGAHTQPKMRKFIGVRSQSFPWLSALTLLYPVGAAMYVLLNTPAPTPMVFGYGIGNLGYLLLAAGVFAGTFRVLGLHRRWQVFVAATVAIIAGILLSNVGFPNQL